MSRGCGFKDTGALRLLAAAGAGRAQGEEPRNPAAASGLESRASLSNPEPTRHSGGGRRGRVGGGGEAGRKKARTDLAKGDVVKRYLEVKRLSQYPDRSVAKTWKLTLVLVMLGC